MSEQIKAQEFLDAIPGSGGMITTIAKRVRCSRPTVYKAMERYPTVKQAIEDERDKNIDLAETKLLEQINEGNTTAIIFFLKTVGKRRGYVEKRIVSVEGWSEFEQMAKEMNLEPSELLRQMTEVLRQSASDSD